MAKALDVDKALSLLGHWYDCSSKWHIRWYIIGHCYSVYAALHILAIVFVGLNPARFHCKVPDGAVPADVIPPDPDNKDILDHCSHYQNFSADTNVTVKGCPVGWEYSDEIDSIVQEWDTVCDDAYMVSTSQTILTGGFLLGAFLVSPVVDRYGRKRVMICSILMASSLEFCSAWVEHYWLFCVFKFCIGFVQQGIIMGGFIFQCEIFPLTDRTVAVLIGSCFWPIGMLVLDFFAYFIRQWRNLMIAVSVPGLLVIPLFWFMPESVTYLVAKGRLREAKEILQAAAKLNGVRLPAEYDLSPEDEKMLNAGVTDIPEPPPEVRRRSSVASAVYVARRSSVGVAVRRMSRAPLPPDGVAHNYTMIDIVKSKRLLSFGLIMAYLWCTSALVYYGLSLNIGNLAGDPYLNFFLSALVEIGANFITVVAMQLIGRRLPLMTFYLIAGIPLFAMIFIPEITAGGTNLKPLVVTLSMIGKFGISACFASVYIYTPELFPTTIRGSGLGIASVGGRSGNLIAPFTPLVADIVPWLPNAVFGTMSILGAILVLFLPETLGRPLPQTIRQVEQWTRTLTPEEKEKFRQSKRTDKVRKKDTKLDVLPEEEEPNGSM